MRHRDRTSGTRLAKPNGQIAVAVRDRVTLFYEDSRYAEYDQSLIRLTARFDIGVLNAAAIELRTGITFGYAARCHMASARM